MQYYFGYNADTSATTGLDGIVCTGSGFLGTIPDLCVRDLTTRTVFIDVYFALDAATTFFYGTVIRAQYGGTTRVVLARIRPRWLLHGFHTEP